MSHPFNVPDFLEDLLIDGKIKELRRYNDVSPFELFVISCPLENGLEVSAGVPSERYPAHLESRFLPGNIVRNSIYKVKLIMQLMKLGTILNQVCS